MKVGVREICDVVLKAKANTTIGNHTFKKGEPVIYFDTLKTSTLEGAATTVYAQGGKGNARLLAWEGERTLTFTMEDALISPKSLAILTGAGLIHAGQTEKAVVKAHATQQVEVAKGNEIIIDSIVAYGTDIYVMLLDSNGEMSGVPVKIGDTEFEYGHYNEQNQWTEDEVITKENTNEKVIPDTATHTKITKAELFYEDDVVFVDFYKEYKSDAVEITITPDKFAGYYYLEASTLFRREADGVDLPAEFIIPKAKIQSAFTFTMASSGDPSTFTFTMDAMPDYTNFNKTEKVLCAIQVLDADDNFDLTSEGDNDTITYTRVLYNEDAKEGKGYNKQVGYIHSGTKQTTDDDTYAKLTKPSNSGV